MQVTMSDDLVMVARAAFRTAIRTHEQSNRNLRKALDTNEPAVTPETKELIRDVVAANDDRIAEFKHYLDQFEAAVS